MECHTRRLAAYATIRKTLTERSAFAFVSRTPSSYLPPVVLPLVSPSGISFFFVGDVTPTRQRSNSTASAVFVAVDDATGGAETPANPENAGAPIAGVSFFSSLFSSSSSPSCSRSCSFSFGSTNGAGAPLSRLRMDAFGVSRVFSSATGARPPGEVDADVAPGLRSENPSKGLGVAAGVRRLGRRTPRTRPGARGRTTSVRVWRRPADAP